MNQRPLHGSIGVIPVSWLPTCAVAATYSVTSCRSSRARSLSCCGGRTLSLASLRRMSTMISSQTSQLQLCSHKNVFHWVDAPLEHLSRLSAQAMLCCIAPTICRLDCRHHIHMNATKWLTLTEFVKHLGKEGKCRVDETPKGWFISLIQADPMAELSAERRVKRDRRAVIALLQAHVQTCT